MTPFGLPPELAPVRVDAAVLTRQRVVVGGGDRTVKLVIAPAVFDGLPGFEVVAKLAV